MDVISSCNFSVDEGDYLNKGDDFGHYLFGGSDMIMLFEQNDIIFRLHKRICCTRWERYLVRSNNRLNHDNDD